MRVVAMMKLTLLHETLKIDNVPSTFLLVVTREFEIT